MNSQLQSYSLSAAAGCQGNKPGNHDFHQLVNMALGEAYRKDRLIMFVVLAFCLGSSTRVMNAFFCFGLQEMWELYQSLKGMMTDTTDMFQHVLTSGFKSNLLN